MLSAILFDHDGVLVASEPLHWAAWRGVSQEIGIPFDELLIRSAVGRTAPQILTALMAKYRPDWSGSPEETQKWVNRKNEIYLERARSALEPYPGVIDGLKWLRANGIATAVVSNARRQELHAMLDHLKLSELMDVIVSREDVKAAKPDPTPYRFAAESLGADPRNCIAVEDSPTGLEAALLSGTRAATVLTNFSRSALESPIPGRPDLRPFWIGNSMIEFFKMIESSYSQSAGARRP